MEHRAITTVVAGVLGTTHLPPPPCISYALVQATVGVGTVIIVYVRNVVRPHKTWVCRHICQLHGAMDTCNMPHARQIHSQEFEVV